ncbi:MAG: glycine betaine ABC transporter substrate-binding protein [Pirellulaceae bacterium]
MNTISCLLLCVALAGQTEDAAADQPAAPEKAGQFAVGSKAFTESVILGEIATLLGREDGYRVQHKDQLGGTVVVWRALLRGEVDVYPEYTGTLIEELFKEDHLQSLQDIRDALARHNVRMTDPLGFNNSYGIGMQEKVAERLGVTKLSDLRNHPQLRFGFSNEFMQRSEGWPTLRVNYDLPQTDVRGLSHDLAYGALVSDDIQAMDVYLTDPKIEALNLRVLEDDLSHFPKYEAVYLYREDLRQRAPRWVAALEDLAGAINRDEMVAMNSQVEDNRDVSEARAAADFLTRKFDLHPVVVDEGLVSRIARYTRDHLFLVIVSMTAAILVSVPLGVLSSKHTAIGHVILTISEVIQTIPGLALLVLLMPIVASIGLNAVGPWPAIIALFLYSLLPIIRNTYTGMRDVPTSLRESAAVLGLTPLAQLRLIELPMASSMILAGIKTTAAINVGYATLGGLIGAGGYGEPIMTGLRLGDPYLMLEGAIPAAILALVVKGVFELAERFLVPRGLRVSTAA